MIGSNDFGIGYAGGGGSVIADNIYTADGSLTEPRVLTGNDYPLIFTGVSTFFVYASNPGFGEASITMQGKGSSETDINFAIVNQSSLSTFEAYGNRTSRFFGHVAVGDFVNDSQVLRSVTDNDAYVAGHFQQDAEFGIALTAFAPQNGSTAIYADASGINGRAIFATGAAGGVVGLVSSVGSIGVSGVAQSNSFVGAIGVLGQTNNPNYNYAAAFKGVVEYESYSKSNLPSIGNLFGFNGMIIVNDAGVSNNELTTCIYNGSDWIDIRTQLPVV